MTRHRSASILDVLTPVLALAAFSCNGGGENHDDHGHAPPHSETAHEAQPREGVIRVDPGMLRDLRITVREAELRPAGDRVTALGELQCDEDRYAEIGSPIPARVARLLAAPGDLVQSGQPLVELDSPDVGRARASVLRAQSRAQLARSVVARREGLAAERIVATRELDTAKAESAEADVELAASEQMLAALGASKGQGTRFTLASPLAGTVLQRNALRGRLVDSEHALFVVGDLSELWLIAHAFERDALRIRTGTTARASFPALPGQEFTGAVTHVGSRVDPASRTVDIRVQIPNADGKLRPGMSATSHIPVGDATPIVTLPVAALQRMPEGWCVFLPRDEAGAYELRPVGRGRDLSGEVEIVRGLQAGERVVVEGAFLLKAEAEKARGTGEEHHH
jgi:cobalt-zinc-cadmium efflux system membrane fusion protein